MALERSGYNRNQQQLYEECKKLMNYHIILTMSDGSMYDGIIVEVNDDRITMLVGEDVIDQECDSQPRQQGSYERQRRFRRFRPRIFPLGALIGLSLLPYPYFGFPFYPFF